MAKKVKAIVKLELAAGKASPAPPSVQPWRTMVLTSWPSPRNITPRTSSRMGEIIPAEITVFQDSSFTFVLKSPPTAVLLKKAAGVEAGSGEHNREMVGSVTRDQVREIADIKMEDLNANDMDAAMRQIEGTARNMGIRVED